MSNSSEKSLAAHNNEFVAGTGDGNVEALGVVEKLAQYLIRVRAGQAEQDHLPFCALDAFHGINQGQIIAVAQQFGQAAAYSVILSAMG